MKNKVYKLITDRFIEALEQNIIPWEKPWSTEGHTPRNAITGRPYSGVNRLILSLSYKYASPFWLTYRQAKELGGSVIEGEKSTPVVFWMPMYYIDGKQVEHEETEGLDSSEYDVRYILRYYNVFNYEQCEDIDEHKLPELQAINHPAISSAERFINHYMAAEQITKGVGPRAMYNPVLDRIVMPQLSDFKNPEYYYKTYFHEIIHSTGHKTRLDRELKGKPDMKEYSKEELTAEIGASFICQEFGIREAIMENSTAYIQGWIKALKQDKGEYYIIGAASRAEKATEFLAQYYTHKEHVLETA